MASLTIHGRSIEIPDLCRVVYPGEDVMKGDVLHYYYRVAPAVMPHLHGRTLSLHPTRDVGRPEGASPLPDESLPSWVREVAASGDADAAPTLVVADEPAVLGLLVQRSCITPYASLSRVESLGRPDRIVFDLNPPAICEEAYLEVCDAARSLGALILEHELAPFVMTSGSRGVHVHVPIYPERVEVASAFARSVAERLVAAHPCRIALAGHDRAGGKVTVDALPSARRSTFVAPYGLRARPGAPVATPLSWDELGASTGPRDHTISSVFGRLSRRTDPWSDLNACARLLPSQATRLSATA
jgi:bifunctional non-homologous end joining protein LigD